MKRDLAGRSGISVGLAGGYTAGHVMPLIAVARAWRRLYPEDRLQCYGTAAGIEAGLVAEAGLPFRALPALPEYGTGRLGRLVAYAAALQGMARGRRALRQGGCDLLLCFGGYVSAGVGLAAASLGTPLAIFEANALPGRTNALLARFADLKLAAMPEVRRCRRWGDAWVTGLPLHGTPREPGPVGGSALPGAAGSARPSRLLVTGGTFGSRFLNRAVPPLAAALRREGLAPEVFHQAGLGQEGEVRAAYRRAGVEATVSGFDGQLPGRWRWADAALCTAGAGTLAEAAASRTPVLAVPLAAVAGGHQEANAAALAVRDGLVWVREAEWQPEREARRVAALLLKARATPGGRPGAGPDAAALLVEELRARIAAPTRPRRAA